MSETLPLLRLCPNGKEAVGLSQDAYVLNADILCTKERFLNAECGTDTAAASDNNNTNNSNNDNKNNDNSEISNAYEMFVFLGKLLGSALRSSNYLDISLVPLAWKKIIGQPVSISDIFMHDRIAYQWIEKLLTKKDELSDSTFEDVYFTTSTLGGKVVELKPDGAKVQH